jgi:hypothetical protein
LSSTSTASRPVRGRPPPRAAAGEQIEHAIAGSAGRLDDPAKDALRLLRGVARLLAPPVGTIVCHHTSVGSLPRSPSRR